MRQTSANKAILVVVVVGTTTTSKQKPTYLAEQNDEFDAFKNKRRTKTVQVNAPGNWRPLFSRLFSSFLLL